MKKLIIMVLTAVAVNVNAQGVAVSAQSNGIFKCNDGEISFFSEATMENIDAHNKKVSSFIHTATKEVVFVIPIRGFKFTSSLMEEHFNEKYMESEKYPDATFQGKINEDIDYSKDGEYKVTATGKMTLHGVEKTITPAGTLTVKGGTLFLKCEFDITRVDYNITVPKIIIENVADVIPVKVSANYLPYKK